MSPSARRGHVIEVLEDRYLLLHGGYNGQQHLADLAVFDLQQEMWVAAPPQGRHPTSAYHQLWGSLPLLLQWGSLLNWLTRLRTCWSSPFCSGPTLLGYSHSSRKPLSLGADSHCFGNGLTVVRELAFLWRNLHVCRETYTYVRGLHTFAGRLTLVSGHSSYSQEGHTYLGTLTLLSGDSHSSQETHIYHGRRACLWETHTSVERLTLCVGQSHTSVERQFTLLGDSNLSRRLAVISKDSHFCQGTHTFIGKLTLILEGSQSYQETHTSVWKFTILLGISHISRAIEHRSILAHLGDHFWHVTWQGWSDHLNEVVPLSQAGWLARVLA